jgi:hypothetical protein
MLTAPDAIVFIETARQQQAPILGVDTFILTEATLPLMEHMLDLSVDGVIDDTWSEALRFVEERQDFGFMFEVVI